MFVCVCVCVFDGVFEGGVLIAVLKRYYECVMDVSNGVFMGEDVWVRDVSKDASEGVYKNIRGHG